MYRYKRHIKSDIKKPFDIRNKNTTFINVKNVSSSSSKFIDKLIGEPAYIKIVYPTAIQFLSETDNAERDIKISLS